MAKATHNGTCQACGAVQAVKADGTIARHGYTLDHGWQSGTCHGSDNPPLEKSCEHLHQTVRTLRWLAGEHEALTVDDIKRVLLRNKHHSVYEKPSESYYYEHNLNDADLRRYTEQSWVEFQQRELGRLKRQAVDMRAHAEDLLELRRERHGKELYPRSK